MKIEKTVDGTAAMLSLSGSLDALTAGELEAAVAALGEGITDLVLDLEKLEYGSSAGLRQFALAQRRMAGKGSFSLVRVPAFVRDVLTMTGLINHMEVLG